MYEPIALGDRFLRRPLPAQIDTQWATELGAEIDRIAKRYERIEDLVRLPPVELRLRAGAARLAELHLHVARLLDDAGPLRAAEAERDKARALAAISATAP